VRDRLPVKTIAPVAAVLAALVMLGSCAYFNTLYNARKIYDKAEELRESKDGEIDRNLKERYNEVITKCGKIIRDYPDSRWVDDAIFLMGKALVRQGEYEKGIRKFVELTTNYPESGYVPESIYWLAMANYEKKDYNQALTYTGRFIEAFPEHKLKFDVMFLAGDISLALEDYEGALGYYSAAAEESGDGKKKEEARLRSAELYFQMEDWANAAAGFESILGKGMDWKRKYAASLSLAICYTKIEKCTEALELCNGLLEEITATNEKPPVMLGRAAGYVCMDSLPAAIREYEEVSTLFPKSDFSAEAYFHMGVIYHERLDSLQEAQEAYAKVSNESPSSEFASIALQRSSSLKRLLELQISSRRIQGEESLAEKRFLSAEIQLTRLGETDLAMGNYRAVVDSFAGTSYAPLAAYAIGWIYRVEKKDTAMAVEAFARLAREYPVTPQARGALYEISLLGEEALSSQLEAFVDSAVADTARIAAEKERARVEAAALAAASVDSSAVAPEDSLGAASPDSLVTVPSPPGAAAADSIPKGGASSADSSRSPVGAPDSSGTRPPPKPPDESGKEQPADTSSSGSTGGREDR
jgi:TolA-binding protein